MEEALEWLDATKPCQCRMCCLPENVATGLLHFQYRPTFHQLETRIDVSRSNLLRNQILEGGKSKGQERSTHGERLQQLRKKKAAAASTATPAPEAQELARRQQLAEDSMRQLLLEEAEEASAAAAQRTKLAPPTPRTCRKVLFLLHFGCDLSSASCLALFLLLLFTSSLRFSSTLSSLRSLIQHSLVKIFD